MRYLVMECRPSYAVVLDRDGRFIKVANLNYTPGQELSDVIPMQIPEKRTQKWVYRLSAVAACLVLLLTGAFAFFRLPYASVYITINPQVRIDVTWQDQVVGLEGVNVDGIDLITGYDYSKKSLDLVMDELVDLAIEKQYLHPGGAVQVNLDARDQNWVTSHTDTLQQQLDTYLTDKIVVEIQMQTGVPAAHHGESDYGETDYSRTDYGAEEITQPAGQPPTATSGNSEYGQTDYGRTVYDPTTAYEAPDTPYEKPDSPYEESTSAYDDRKTDYKEPQDSKTDYKEPKTDYEDPKTDYEGSKSDYDD